MRNPSLLALLVLSACSASTPETESSPPAGPDTAYIAGRVHTGVDGAAPARVVIVHADGEIASVHETVESAGLDDSVEIVDLGDAVLFPGFTDAHAHLMGIGQRELTLDLAGTASIDELVTRIEAELGDVEAGRVLVGRGWIETDWPEGRMPAIGDLDPAAPDHPVLLVRADGHAMAVNSAALEAAGITRETPDPSGGLIERDEAGNATGILVDNAMSLVSSLMAEPSEADVLSALTTGAQVYASRGWTNVHNMSVDPGQAALLERLDLEGRMPVRLLNAYDRAGFGLAEKRNHETATIQNRTVKLYMDGALGSRGAQLVAPYSDRPGLTGLSLIDDSDLDALMTRAGKGDVQLAIHAIGDLANRRILDLVEASHAEDAKRLRWRIEHTQILQPADIERVARANLVASMQPSHAIGDLKFAPARLGLDRLSGAYAWRSLIDSGAVLAGGSDAPVEVGSPLIEFYAAVARRDLEGFSGEGWHPEEVVTRAEALKMFTLWPAYASFQEDVLGTIEPGKRADFTVFDRDLMTVPHEEILDAEPVMTVVDGDIVWRADP